MEYHHSGVMLRAHRGMASRTHTGSPVSHEIQLFLCPGQQVKLRSFGITLVLQDFSIIERGYGLTSRRSVG